MLTNPRGSSETSSVIREASPVSVSAPQKVVIVNGSAAIMGLVESILDAGRYDIVFVESSARAYSAIKRVRPGLVILCVSVEEMGGFQVLSMLKLDDETRHIPILTYAAEYDGRNKSDDEGDSSAAEALRSTAAHWMN
jgi:PleD family two-component response regulator